ncbi:MAG: hypothetical protein AAFU53_14320 [Cyanobacteria bacterium J06632_3]
MMKHWKLLSLFFLGAIAAITAFQLRGNFYPEPDVSDALASQPTETCLSPSQETRPVWECYEISVALQPHETVEIEHESGEQHRVLTFSDNGETKFRFTPSQTGTWRFSTGDTLTINAERPDYAKGFMIAQGNKWARSATGKAFVPQFVMYDKPDLEAGLDEFVEGHGFTGFHITNLRDFLDNPAYFEAAILKTYRRGGATHFWIWGDASRNQSPGRYDVDVAQLYTEIAARLLPLPGWSVGYGFDLFEWASAEELEDFQARMHAASSYRHMMSGRGHKNQYREISSNLDYASWEWHQPSYEDYREHLERANGRPAFSEDRFRIRVPSRYPEKDYNPDLTIDGLWDSAIAGGIANIWGHQPKDKQFSEPYPNKAAIKTYSTFIDKTFTASMEPDNSLISSGHCLRDQASAAICYAKNTNTVELNLNRFGNGVSAIAVNTQAPYSEVNLTITPTNNNIQLPQTSTWAFHIVQE